MLSSTMAQGLDLIEKAELREDAVMLGLVLSDTDRSILLNYWYGFYLSQLQYYENLKFDRDLFTFPDFVSEVDDAWGPWRWMFFPADFASRYLACAAGLPQDEARELERRIRVLEDDPFYAYFRCGTSFCGRIRVSTPILSFDIDTRAREFQFTFGAGLQFRAGWNLRKNEPIVGIGYGASFSSLISAGVVVRYRPSTGVVGSLDVGSGIPVMMPGSYGIPSRSIVKFGQFWN